MTRAVEQYIDSSSPPRRGEELDQVRLHEYLQELFPDSGGPLVVEQFPCGFSNLTYRLRLGERELVLRRPPFGNVVKTAHDMGREYRVLAYLCEVYRLAPRPYAYCADASILGAPFYVMERRHGIILRDTVPDGLWMDAETMRQLSRALIDNLARLHLLDYQAAGLGDVGEPEGYVTRQVKGWTERYRKAQTDDIPAMHDVAGWLAENMPAASAASLIHNDYKYDNLVLDAGDVTRIIAVLDWEMATVGDPLMDLGTTLGYWVEPTDPEGMRAMAFGPTMLAGNMTRQELVERYQAHTGRDVLNAVFYYCYGLFKIAVIVQQIHARYVRGHTTDERFAQLSQGVAMLGERAAWAIDRETI